MAPCLIDYSNKIDIFVGKIDCTACMFHHGDMLLLPHARRIMQHRDRTRCGNSAFPFHFVFRIGSCIFSFGVHISSWSRTWDTTLIRGLNHGWNRTIVNFGYMLNLPFLRKTQFFDGECSVHKQNCATSPFGKPALKLWESLLMNCLIACQMSSWHNAQIAVGGSNNPDPTHNFLSTPTMKSAVHADTGDVCTGMQSRRPPALTSQSMTKELAQHTQLPQILLGAMFV